MKKSILNLKGISIQDSYHWLIMGKAIFILIELKFSYEEIISFQDKCVSSDWKYFEETLDQYFIVEK